MKSKWTQNASLGVFRSFLPKVPFLGAYWPLYNFIDTTKFSHQDVSLKKTYDCILSDDFFDKKKEKVDRNSKTLQPWF